MKPNTKIVLKVMHVLSWITFIGLCISTGTLLYAIIVSAFINPVGIIDPVNGFDLFALKKLGTSYFVNVSSLVILISILKTYMFYLVIKIFIKINLTHPFSCIMPKLLSKICYVAFSIGLLSYVATSYSSRLPDHINGLSELTDGFHEFIFFAGIIFIISLIFQKGIEIQSENELTI